ncbi:MAG: RNA 2',3'-cyclic phosphodiesterase [Ignavibacteriales bacterium]|nr:MAG: RNA 2',3'-cyclic phosphodiesterase [Ignavibacteriales bacterium]
MIRLFIALDIPEEIIEKIITLRNSVIANPYDYKWENPEKIHLTIKFIGEVNDNLVPEIIDEISFVSAYKPFSCSFGRFGFFYSKDNPVILWLGLNINQEIFSLERKLNDKLVKFGIKEEKRKFKPHLTLMRIKKKIDKNFLYSFENCKLPGTEFTLDSVSLIKSEFHSYLPGSNAGDSIYTQIKNYNLMGGY